MDVTVILSAIGAVGTAFVSYMVTRNNNKKDLTIRVREELAQEQKDMRKELRMELKQIRDEMNIWRDRSLHLEDELRAWKEKYMILEIDYAKAVSRIGELERRLGNEEGRT